MYDRTAPGLVHHEPASTPRFPYTSPLVAAVPCVKIMPRAVLRCLTTAGAIPDAIGGLSCLTSLRLDHNSLSGRLPGALTRLTNLTVLDLAWNKLTGTIPMRIGTMTTLRSLNLGMNKARWQACDPRLARGSTCWSTSNPRCRGYRSRVFLDACRLFNDWCRPASAERLCRYCFTLRSFHGIWSPL